MMRDAQSSPPAPTREAFLNCLRASDLLAAAQIEQWLAEQPPDADARSLATALGDTISTELGQIYGKKTYSLITLKRVRTGTEGAVSLEGTLLGFGASIALAVLAYFFHPEFAFPNSLHLGLKGVVVISLAAMMANFIESLIGGILQQFDLTGPEMVMNFLNTLVGAVLAIVWFS